MPSMQGTLSPTHKNMWHMPVSPALGSWRQKDPEFKVILGYIVQSQPGLRETVSKNK